jgi:hypothetical protein
VLPGLARTANAAGFVRRRAAVGSAGFRANGLHATSALLRVRASRRAYPRWIQLAGCGDKSGTNSRLETFLLSEIGEGSSRSMRFPWPVIRIHGPLRVTGSARVSGQRLGAGANGLPADTLAVIDRRAKYGYCLLRKVAEGPSWILDGDKMSHSF